MRLLHLSNLIPGLRRRTAPDDPPNSIDGNPASGAPATHPVTPQHLRRLPHLLLKRARRPHVRDVLANSVHSEVTGESATFIGSDTYGSPSVAHNETPSPVRLRKAPNNARNAYPPPIEVNVAQQVEVTLQSLEPQNDADPFAPFLTTRPAEGPAHQYLLPQPHRNAPPRPRRSPLRAVATAASSPSLSPKASSDTGFRESPSPPMRTPSAGSMALLMHPPSRALENARQDEAHICDDEGQDVSSTDGIAPSSPTPRASLAIQTDVAPFPERQRYQDALRTIDFLLHFNTREETPEQRLATLKAFVRGQATAALFVPFGQTVRRDVGQGQADHTSDEETEVRDPRTNCQPSFPPLLAFPTAPATPALALQNAPALGPVKLPSISPTDEAAHVAAGRIYLSPNAPAAHQHGAELPFVAPPARNKRKRSSESSHSLSTFVFPAAAPPAAGPKRKRSPSPASARHDPDEDAHQRLPPGFAIRHRAHALTVVRKLGAGAYGAVYLVRDAAGTALAAKVMPRAFGAYDTVRTEFEVLRRAARQGERFIAELVMAFEDERFLCFVMRAYVCDLVDVPCLSVRTNGVKAQFDYYRTIAELVHGLARLHALGYAHLDIKPENILVARTGHIAYADFGLARPVDAAGRVLGAEHFGTVGYDAPEGYLRGLFASPSSSNNNTHDSSEDDGAVTQSADVWSLGITIVRLLTQRTPYTELVAAKLCAWGATARPGSDAYAALREAATRLAVAECDPLRTQEVLTIKAHNPFLYALLAKMLVRDPRLRWTAEQLKAHEYFRYIDWAQLEKGEPLYDVSRNDEARSADSSSPRPSPFDFSYPRSKDLDDKDCERCKEEAAPACEQKKMQDERSPSGDASNTDDVR